MEISKVLRCPYCHSEDIESGTNAFRCCGCALSFPIVQNVLNTLVQPSEDVVRELQGMMEEAHESGLVCTDVNQFIVHQVDKVSTLAERQKISQNEPHDYYKATEMNLKKAIEYVDFRDKQTILEIGGHNDYPFLLPFRDRGLQCFETNIYFVYDDKNEYQDWPHKVAADMNGLPFRDKSFDIVLASATTHHSPDLDTTIKEMARVTKPGGSVLIINDPTFGLFKHTWDRLKRDNRFAKGGVRASLIHENEYSLLMYLRLFKKHGFAVESSFFSAYYDEKLTQADFKSVRWESIASTVSRFWRYPWFNRPMKTYGLWLGQTLIGLEMNVVLKKC